MAYTYCIGRFWVKFVAENMLKKFCERLKIFFEMLKFWLKWGEGKPSDARVLLAKNRVNFSQNFVWQKTRSIKK